MNARLLEKRAAAIRLAARSLAESMQSGGFASLYRGQGVEFSGVREYEPGLDDVRSIDWNVTARMNRPFVKEYEVERELSVFIALDISRSMQTGRPPRLHTACEAASLLALAAAHTASPTGAVFFDRQIQFSMEPKAGQTQTMLLLSKCDAIMQERGSGGNGSALGSALKGAAKLLKKRSLVVVLSDFRTDAREWEKDFALLAAKHDLVAARISDASDMALSSAGGVPFCDTESALRRTLPTGSAAFRRAWREAETHRAQQWKNICLRRGAWPLTLDTNSDCAVALSRFFAGRRA